LHLKIKNRAGQIIFIVSTVFFAYLAVLDPAYIDQRIESLSLIYRFQIRNLISKPNVPENITIVFVDEKSLKEFGRWPWSRSLQAKLIGKVLKDNPKVLAIDILYSEAENKKSDGEMAKVLEPYKDKVVIAHEFEVPLEQPEEKDVPQGPEPPDYFFDNELNVKDLKPSKFIKPGIAVGIMPAISEVGQNAKLGHAYNYKDIDGKTIWEFLYLKYNDGYYPSLSLQTARIAMNISNEKTILYRGRGIALGDRMVPFYPKGGKMLINYLGGGLTFHHVSAADVLKGNVEKNIFKDKIVFLGTSAVATHDIINTPFTANMPGVEKNATVVENILNNRFIEPPYHVVAIAVVLLTGILFGLVFSRMKALRASFYSILTILLYLVIAQILFTYYGIRMNIIYPLSNMLIIFTGTTITKYFLEERKAKEIRAMFSSYVSPKIVEILINDPEKAGIGGIRREITVLFSDIRGFTSISEKHSPEEVVAILNEYLSAMTDIVFKWDGTLDKFIGDAILAFWGAPIIQEDHAELAVKCAMNMTAKLDELQKKWEAEGKPRLDIGIGINTGEVLVGNIGAVGKKMDYTVIGDNVNLGSRVESLTKKYNCRILITESTLDKIRASLASHKIGHVSVLGKERVVVKGKEKPVGIFELLTLEHNIGSTIVECKDSVVEMKEK